MRMKKAVGKAGASRKYDLLTILGVYALSQDKRLQRQTLRLICLITARYNWQNDQLATGQTEIARLWSVDPRTVKREMAAFRTRGWLIEKRAPARGRVTVYGLGISQILEDTKQIWEMVGSDLVDRLEDAPAMERKVIPFPQASLPEGDDLWSRVARHLQAGDAGTYRAWFAMLEPRVNGDTLFLKTPSSFHASYLKTHLRTRVETALAREDPACKLEFE